MPSLFFRLSKIFANGLFLKIKKVINASRHKRNLQNALNCSKYVQIQNAKIPRNSKFRGTFYFCFSGISRQKNCINYVKFAGNRLCNLQASIKINFDATTDFPNSWHCQNSVRNLIKNGNSGVSRRGVNSENLRDLGKV